MSAQRIRNLQQPKTHPREKHVAAIKKREQNKMGLIFLPQATEQGLHSLHSETTQSTGKLCSLPDKRVSIWACTRGDAVIGRSVFLTAFRLLGMLVLTNEHEFMQVSLVKKLFWFPRQPPNSNSWHDWRAES